ncbi:MAG: hypothetical protein RLZZ111_1313 [Planctomycetota bacterium]|jgi:hypothetical protein
MTDGSIRPAETWLRGNLRPVVWLGAAGLAVAGAVLAAVAAVAMSPAGWLLAAAVWLAGVLAVGLLARAAALPRLERRGDVLRIRLSPGTTEDVPLQVVECFFPGSNPISRAGEPTCGSHAAFRVNTLVMRLAERAVDQAARPTFTPWGTWDDGYVIFDGRWCEPLSPALARALGHRLIEAKRSPASGCGGTA